MNKDQVLINLSSAIGPVQKIFTEALRTLATDHAVSSAILATPLVQVISDAVVLQLPVEFTLMGAREGKVKLLISGIQDMEPTGVQEKYVVIGTFADSGKKFVAFLVAGLTAPGILFEAKTKSASS